MESKKLPELKTAVNERRRPSSSRKEGRGWWEILEQLTQEPSDPGARQKGE